MEIVDVRIEDIQDVNSQGRLVRNKRVHFTFDNENWLYEDFPRENFNLDMALQRVKDQAQNIRGVIEGLKGVDLDEL